MDIKEFAKKVQEMRAAQKQYFKARKMGLQAIANDWLTTSKALEKEVDTMTTAILAESKPQSMF
jgi:hypothetical protein